MTSASTARKPTMATSTRRGSYINQMRCMGTPYLVAAGAVNGAYFAFSVAGQLNCP